MSHSAITTQKGICFSSACFSSLIRTLFEHFVDSDLKPERSKYNALIDKENRDIFPKRGVESRVEKNTTNIDLQTIFYFASLLPAIICSDESSNKMFCRTVEE
jgi:hypothetical protein